jgi:hypothetical protein
MNKLPLYILESIAIREHLVSILPANYTYCEVGVRRGDFFDIMVRLTLNTCVAVDLWELAQTPSQNDDCQPLENLKKIRLEFQQKYKKKNNILIYHKHSLDAAKDMLQHFGEQYFDMVYIDADHSYNAVLQDLEAYYPLVKSGGFLAGHDYAECTFASGTKCGVIPAVNQFAAKQKLKIYLTKEPHIWKSWILIKP